MSDDAKNETVQTPPHETIQAQYKEEAAILGDAVYRAWVALDRMKVLNVEMMGLAQKTESPQPLAGPDRVAPVDSDVH